MSQYARKSQVLVRFFDADTGVEFATSTMPPESLPESFRAETMMKLKGEEWKVVVADPQYRAQFAVVGELKLTLRRENPTMVSIDPREIRYTLATVEAQLPPTRPHQLWEGPVLQLHDDDWRQTEFVSYSRADEVNETFREIAKIYREHRFEDGGFSACYLRDRIPIPLGDEPITVKEARSIFHPNQQIYDEIAIPPIGAWVDQPFALRSQGGIILFGSVTGANLDSLAVTIEDKANPSGEELQLLANFANAHKLFLIHWIRGWPYSPTPAEFARFAAGEAPER